MIVDYCFGARLREKYDKIAEEKFGSKFHFYSLQYKEEFEEYDKNLKIFKYLFSLGDEARIYLWNNIAISSLFDDIYKNIQRDDLTKEEDGVKVLLVANEQEFLKTTDPDSQLSNQRDKNKEPSYTPRSIEYLRKKEKTISDTIIYETDKKEALKGIIKLFFADNLSETLITEER